MYADVSAIEWVTYLTRIQGFSRAQAHSLAVQALKRVDLSEHQNRKISTYSRGMRQRARLAQAIAHEPDFLILDEPFSGLDPIARHAMTTFLQSWIADGRNLLISSHVLYEIESLTRSFLLLNGGRLLAAGAMDDITPLLGNTPTDIVLHCKEYRKLAAELVSAGLIDRVNFPKEGELQISTSNAIELNEHIAKGVSDGRYLIQEFRSSDDSLQEVFDSLMKSHRGVA
jgi:ABC-2 type transport system ATP-binding protein